MRTSMIDVKGSRRRATDGHSDCPRGTADRSLCRRPVLTRCRIVVWLIQTCRARSARGTPWSRPCFSNILPPFEHPYPIPFAATSAPRRSGCSRYGTPRPLHFEMPRMSGLQLPPALESGSFRFRLQCGATSDGESCGNRWRRPALPLPLRIVGPGQPGMPSPESGDSPSAGPPACGRVEQPRLNAIFRTSAIFASSSSRNGDERNGETAPSTCPGKTRSGAHAP